MVGANPVALSTFSPLRASSKPTSESVGPRRQEQTQLFFRPLETRPELAGSIKNDKFKPPHSPAATLRHELVQVT